MGRIDWGLFSHLGGNFTGQTAKEVKNAAAVSKINEFNDNFKNLVGSVYLPSETTNTVEDAVKQVARQTTPPTIERTGNKLTTEQYQNIMSGMTDLGLGGLGSAEAASYRAEKNISNKLTQEQYKKLSESMSDIASGGSNIASEGVAQSVNEARTGGFNNAHFGTLSNKQKDWIRLKNQNLGENNVFTLNAKGKPEAFMFDEATNSTWMGSGKITKEGTFTNNTVVGKGREIFDQHKQDVQLLLKDMDTARRIAGYSPLQGSGVSMSSFGELLEKYPIPMAGGALALGLVGSSLLSDRR